MKLITITIIIKNLLQRNFDAEPAYVLTMGVVIQVEDAAATKEVAIPLEESRCSTQVVVVGFGVEVMATFVLVIIVVTDGITVWLELVMVISSPLVSLDVYVTGLTVVIDIVDSVECTSTDVVVMALGVMTDVIVTY